MVSRSSLILLICNAISISAFAQWNTSTDMNVPIYRTGNVGIGTTNAYDKLVVKGGTLHMINPSYTFISRDVDPYAVGNDSYFYHKFSTDFHLLGSSKNGSGTLRKIGFAVGPNDSELDIKMVIDQNGRVGIGTKTPQQALTIIGRAQSISTGYGFAHVTSESSTSNQYLTSNFSANAFQLVTGQNGGNVVPDFILGTNDIERMRISAGGLVSLGGVTPAAQLHLGSNVDHEIRMTRLNGTFGFRMFRNATNGKFLLQNTDDSNTWGTRIQFDEGGSSWQNLILNPTAGNVGIGTTAPDAKLAVKGTIHTQEVKVDLQGAVAPDYVFEKSYDLQPLAEVESYINQHKHLPEVPSAKEMEENGLNLKEMNLLLLKKMEELTLHLIEMKKENEKQNERNDFLQKQIDAIKTQKNDK